MSLEQQLASLAVEAIPTMIAVVKEVAQHPPAEQPAMASRLLKAAAAESALLRTLQADLDAGRR